MKNIFHDNLFEYDDDGVLQCYPIDEKDARETYINLIKEKDDLRTKINQEEHLLDLLSGDNQIKNKSSLKVLILLKDRLNKTNDKFESIKNWYDENKIPPPGSSEDNKKIKLQKLYVEKVRARIVNEQISDNQHINKSVNNNAGKPKGRNPRKLKRDSNIIVEYDKMLQKGLTTEHIRDTLAKKHDLSPHTIKSIYYKYIAEE